MMNRDELIQKMRDAYRGFFDRDQTVVSDAEVTHAMGLALDVAKEELLREPTFEELTSASSVTSIAAVGAHWKALTEKLIASRRAQLDKVKTLQEQIEEIIGRYVVGNERMVENCAEEITRLLAPPKGKP